MSCIALASFTHAHAPSTWHKLTCIALARFTHARQATPLADHSLLEEYPARGGEANIIKEVATLILPRSVPSMAPERSTAGLSRWELAAESIAVKIRWFGLLFGYILVNTRVQSGQHQIILNAILALGVGYALVDTVNSMRG